MSIRAVRQTPYKKYNGTAPTKRTDTVIPYRIAHVYVLESGLDFWPCTDGLQRNVHSVGFLVYLVETTDMQQLRAFTLAICVVVAVVVRAQRFSPGEPLASAMCKSRRQGKRVTAPGCPPLVISGPARNQVVLCQQ